MTSIDSRYTFEYVPPGIVRAGFSDMTDFCIKCKAENKTYYFEGVGKGQGYGHIYEYVIEVPHALDHTYGASTGWRIAYVKTIVGAVRSDIVAALRAYIELDRNTHRRVPVPLRVIDGESQWSWPNR